MTINDVEMPAVMTIEAVPREEPACPGDVVEVGTIEASGTMQIGVDYAGRGDGVKDPEVVDFNTVVRQAFAVADAKRACRRVPGLIPQRRGTIRRMERVGRNDPCPCGSGQKAKRCCL